MDPVYFKILDDLAIQGYSYTSDFMPVGLIDEILQEQKLLLDKGKFRQAGVGRGESFKVRPEIRGDQVLWVDDFSRTSLQNRYLDKIEELRSMLNQEFFLGLNGFECHFTQYPPNTFYKKHIDQFQQASHRIISCILYLNMDWKDEYGGQLRIYPDQDNEAIFEDFNPIGGAFACFRSDTILHEVLPTKKERYSVTGWLRR